MLCRCTSDKTKMKSIKIIIEIKMVKVEKFTQTIKIIILNNLIIRRLIIWT
jgi:hypothetical protein